MNFFSIIGLISLSLVLISCSAQKNDNTTNGGEVENESNNESGSSLGGNNGKPIKKGF